jgi:hypothetical protein
MAQCACCKEETEFYIGGDVPICTECFDAQEAKSDRPATKDGFRNILLQDYLEATALNNQATWEFEAVMGQFPSGLPHPVGAQRIKNASSKLSAARERMMTAHNRLNDYIDRGIVPEDSIAVHDSVQTA